MNSQRLIMSYAMRDAVEMAMWDFIYDGGGVIDKRSHELWLLAEPERLGYFNRSEELDAPPLFTIDLAMFADA